MFSITNNRLKNLFTDILHNIQSSIVLFDIGSGGELKAPWSNIPDDLIEVSGIDPELTNSKEEQIKCISTKSGPIPFYVANDPRASSLHKVNTQFISRFGMENMLERKTLMAYGISADDYLGNKIYDVDVVDINTEGHDLHVLKSSKKLFSEGTVKMLKIEFEMALVWNGQGFFSDIDTIMRSWDYELVKIEVETARPVAFPNGNCEPVWGKAFYVPGMAYWSERIKIIPPLEFKKQILKAIAIYIICNMPSRAMELIHIQSDLETAKYTKLIKGKLEYAYRFEKMDQLINKLFNPVTRLFHYFISKTNK